MLCLSLIMLFVPIEYHNELTDIIFGTGLISTATIYMPGCGTPPAPTCEDCPTKELGGVRAMWVQKASYTFANIQDPNEWQTAICAGNVYVFPFTNGDVTPSGNETDGYGNLPTTLDSYTYTANVHEPQYKKNVPFWNFIKKGISYKFGYKTQSMLHLSSVPAQFTPLATVSKDVKSKIDMAIKVMWVQTDIVQPIDAGNASSIFDTCVDC